jgi:hypothetical protein
MGNVTRSTSDSEGPAREERLGLEYQPLGVPFDVLVVSERDRPPAPSDVLA